MPRTVPMPATPGSPLEPLRAGRRLDRRHWLLAGLLGILAGGFLLDGALGVTAVLPNPLLDPLALARPVGSAIVGVVGVIVAFALAPGGAARRILGVVVVLVGVGLALGLSAALLGGAVRVPLEVRWVVSPQSVLVGAGIVGWLLASGARWWAFPVLLLTPLVAAAPTALVLRGVDGALLATPVVAVLVALIALLLSIPRRR